VACCGFDRVFDLRGICSLCTAMGWDCLGGVWGRVVGCEGPSACQVYRSRQLRALRVPQAGWNDVP